jgi:hypothetical protein
MAKSKFPNTEWLGVIQTKTGKFNIVHFGTQLRLLPESKELAFIGDAIDLMNALDEGYDWDFHEAAFKPPAQNYIDKWLDERKMKNASSSDKKDRRANASGTQEK